MAEISHVLKGVEEKTTQQRQQDAQSQQQMQQMQQQAEAERQESKQRFEAEQKALDRQNQLDIAEIRSAGYTAMKDFNENSQSDYIDSLEYLDKKRAKQDDLTLRREQELNRNSREMEKLSIKQQELNTRTDIAEKELAIARENKNKYDAKK
jgi:hypothetical protein